MPFPHYTQLDAMDCGATCLRMVAKYYGKSYSSQTNKHAVQHNNILWGGGNSACLICNIYLCLNATKHLNV